MKKRMILISALVILSAIASFSFTAQTDEKTSVFITCSALFTGTELLENMVIRIENGIIRDVVSAKDFSPPAGAKIIDATGMTVFPGLVDSHVHIQSIPLPYLAEIEQRGFGRMVEQFMSNMPQNRLEFLQNGITTVIDMGSPLASIQNLKKQIEAGTLSGPRIFDCGPLFTPPGGHPAGTIYVGQHDLIENGTVQVVSKEQIIEKIDECKSAGVDFIKIVYDGGALRKPFPKLDLDMARFIVQYAHGKGLKVFAHTGVLQKEAMDMVSIGVDGIEHSFIAGTDTEEGLLQAVDYFRKNGTLPPKYRESAEKIFTEMKRQNMIFTPTLAIFDVVLHDPVLMKLFIATVEIARETGVTVAAGTDFPSSGGEHAGQDLFKELSLLEKAGYTRLDALKCATLNPAVKLGFENEIGSIRSGNFADLVFYKGTVTDGTLSPSRIEKVMANGVVRVENSQPTPETVMGATAFSLIPAPYFFYGQFTGYVIGMSLTYFNTFDTGIMTNLGFNYSFNNWVNASLFLNFPSPIPATTISARFGFNTFGFSWFGIGNLNDPVAYDTLIQTVFTGGVSFRTTLDRQLYLSSGFWMEYRQFNNSDIAHIGAPLGTGGGFMDVLSLGIISDDRDNGTDPWFGGSRSLQIDWSASLLGSVYSYVLLTADFTQFFSIFHRHILAFHLLFKEAFGDVPFYAMPSFGGTQIGRGYFDYFLLDKTLLALQVEYRFRIWNFIGMKFYADIGQVAPDIAKLTFDGFHYTFGGGPVIAFSDYSMLIFLFTYNETGLGFTFNFGHTF